MKPVFETLDNWAAGVVTTLESHMLPPMASPRAWNSVLRGVGGGKAIFGKRDGLRTLNSTPISGSPAILAQIDYQKLSGGSLTPYHLIVSDNGRMDKLNADTTTSPADSVTPAPFTSGTYRPDWATAKNYLYLVNGQDAKKFDGSTVWKFGIDAPGSAPTAVDSGVAGVPNGTYEAAIAYYNSATGHYSSRGPTVSVTVANRQIDVGWSAPADAQITHVVVGIRNTASQPQLWEATKIAIGTTTYRYNGDPTTLTVLMPDADENDAPPSGMRGCEWHAGNRRMFLHDGSQLYYSKQDQPEAFDPDNVQPVRKDDGDTIIAVHYAHSVLMVFKRHATYLLVGDTPSEWRIEILDRVVGARTHLGIVTVAGVTYWISERGLAAWDGSGAVQFPGQALLRPTFSADTLNIEDLGMAQLAVDPTNNRVLIAVPEAGQSRNTMLIPYNYKAGVFESTKWDPMDVSSLATLEEDDVPTVFLGGYKGQVFRVGDTANDGVPAGTMTGSVTGATSSTVSDSGASFHTTGGGLIERYVVAIDPLGTRIQRRRITANTGTQLTITPNWGTTPSSTWTYIVGGPDWQVDTPWGFMGMPFVKKRFQFLHAFLTSTNSEVDVDVEVFLDFNLQATAPDKSFTITVSGPGAQWDQVQWDSGARWGGIAPFMPSRKRIGQTGLNWRARFKNRQPDQDVAILMVAMSGEALSMQLG